MNQSRITIGVGCGLRKDGRPISVLKKSLMTMRAKQMLLHACGGFTITQAEGGWRDKDGKDWEEPCVTFVTVVETGAINPEALACLLRDTFDQICVSLIVEPVTMKLI